MRKLYILLESEATESDRDFWKFLKELKSKTMNSNVEHLEIETLTELLELEKKLTEEGWSRIISDLEPRAFSSPYRPCMIWEK